VTRLKIVAVPAVPAHTLRRWPVVVATVGVLAAACSTSGPTGNAGSGSTSAAKVVAAAFQATRGAHTARVQIRIQVSAGSAGSSLNASTTADGVLDFANGTQDLTIRQPTGGTLETRTVGGATYTQLPAGVAGRAGTKPWLKVVVPAGLKRPSSLTDPTQVLGLLRGAARSVTTVGKETVRGERTTHYKVQIDLTKLQAEAGRTAASGQPNPYSLLRKLLGRDTLPMDVWVDSQQRIARLRTVLPLPSGAGAATAPTAAPAPSLSPTPAGTATSIEEFYDFGVPVNVQAPPPDQVQSARTVVPPGAVPSPPAPAHAAPPPPRAAPSRPESVTAPAAKRAPGRQRGASSLSAVPDVAALWNVGAGCRPARRVPWLRPTASDPAVNPMTSGHV